jgi:predicted nucleic acid-binding protein
LIILDADILIEIYDKESKIGESAFKKIMESGDTFCTTAINLHEVLYGLIKYGRPSGYVAQLPILDYSKEDAILAAELELASEGKGKKIARIDAMVAAITINSNARLFTNNKKHFSGIEKLEIF